jgi:hypothetical protein
MIFEAFCSRLHCELRPHLVKSQNGRNMLYNKKSQKKTLKTRFLKLTKTAVLSAGLNRSQKAFAALGLIKAIETLRKKPLFH